MTREPTEGGTTVRQRLVIVGRGSRDREEARAVTALVKGVARRLEGTDVVGAFADATVPTLGSVMAGASGPSVVVPLFLSADPAGTEIAEAARLSPFPVTVARSLGPHPLLAAAGAMQLRAAGATRGDPVVMLTSGAKDADATADALVAGRLLRAHWGAAVRTAFLNGAGPSVREVVGALREEGHRRIVASPYLLAPGHLSARAAALARSEGLASTGDVLAQHPLTVELVVRRYVAARRVALGVPSVASAVRRPRVA